jgi:hypothetical protein
MATVTDELKAIVAEVRALESRIFEQVEKVERDDTCGYPYFYSDLCIAHHLAGHLADHLGDILEGDEEALASIDDMEIQDWQDKYEGGGKE